MNLFSKKNRPSGRGAILIIALLLISSAVLRFGIGSGPAVAQALTQPIKADDVLEKEHAPADTEMNPIQAETVGRAELGGLLGALQKRERRVKTMEKQIEMRRRALQIADQEIRKRLASLEKAEVTLRKTLALADGAAEDDLARLTAVYENMKPKDAAALFATMEPDFAAGFLGRMRPDAAAAVMTGLPPEVAYSISVILAGRNANAPKS